MKLFETTLLVEVAEAEPHVRAIRDEHDAVALRGIPAHITLVYPFVPPDRLSVEVRRALRELFAGVAPFAFAVTDVRRFGDTTVYLGLDDEVPFRQLTQVIHARFPDRPPYGGRYEDVIPHLTLGDGLDQEAVDRLLVAPALRQLPLPIFSRAREARLMVEGATGWRVADRFPFRASGEAIRS